MTQGSKAFFKEINLLTSSGLMIIGPALNSAKSLSFFKYFQIIMKKRLQRQSDKMMILDEAVIKQLS